MTRTPIPNCPQEDKPIRDRAWTDEQITEVCEALLRQRQCDHDGMECIVSREACCIAADMLRSTLTQPHPARSGGVSDADVEDAARYRWLRRNHNADLLAEDVIDEAIQGERHE